MYKILLVDDNTTVLNQMRMCLSDTYTVMPAKSGAAALKVISRESPDFVFTDVKMPQMDGFVLFGKLREAGVTCPIAFLTGDDDEHCAHRAVEMGAAGVIAKPPCKARLLEFLGKYL